MKSPTRRRKFRPEYVVAAIGLFGGISTAVLSNWDKLTGTTVTAEYSGYRPTGDIETELRYLLEVNGTRTMVNEMNNQVFANARTLFTQEIPDDPQRVNRLVDILKRNSFGFDDAVSDLIPIWKRHFTLDQIQQLNKFYSTPEMQTLVKIQPAILKEYMPAVLEKVQKAQQKSLEEIDAELSTIDDPELTNLLNTE